MATITAYDRTETRRGAARYTGFKLHVQHGDALNRTIIARRISNRTVQLRVVSLTVTPQQDPEEGPHYTRVEVATETESGQRREVQFWLDDAGMVELMR